MISKQLGSYEILEELGRGGMATVYRAYHPAMDRFVAVKVLREVLADDKVHLNRFNQEARVIARLEHPHLLPVYDFSGDSNPVYIVMRYLEGITLKQVCETVGGKLPLHEITHIIRQIAAALDYAHANGVIHRDIKPSNIMVDVHGNCFLTDFGIASIMGEGSYTQTGTLLGTPAYMSPEQIVGEEALTPAADIYSLAVIIFELATGRQPYTAPSLMGIMRKHVEAPIPSATKYNPALPPIFDKIMRKGLAKKPSARFASATAMAHSLEKLLSPDEAFLPPDTLKSIALKEVKRIRANRSNTQSASTLPNLENPEQSEALKETIRLLETPGKTSTSSMPRRQFNSCLYYTVGLIVFIAFTAILLSFIGLPTESEQDAVATGGVETRAALALAQTATAQPRATATSTVTPSRTPTPTATVPMQTNQFGNVYLDVPQPEPTLVFAQSEFYSADHAFQIDLNHIGSDIESARIFAEPDSRILVDDVNKTGIRLAAARNSRFIVSSGSYVVMEIGFDDAPLTYFYLEEDQSCAAVDYTPVNTLNLDCLAGTCTYTLTGSTGSRGALQTGQRVIVSLPEQTIRNISPIPVEDLLHYEDFLKETGSGISQLGCVEPLLPTPTPTVTVVNFPTIQAPPIPHPYR